MGGGGDDGGRSPAWWRHRTQSKMLWKTLKKKKKITKKGKTHPHHTENPGNISQSPGKKKTNLSLVGSRKKSMGDFRAVGEVMER